MKNKTISKTSINRKELQDEIKDNRYETDLINHSIESFDWSKLFSSKNLDEKVELFNKNITKYFLQFYSIQNHWVNDEILKKIIRKNWLFQSQIKLGKLDFAVLNSTTEDISDTITSSKLKY